MMRRLFLMLMAVGAVAATKPVTDAPGKSSAPVVKRSVNRSDSSSAVVVAKPQAEGEGAPNPAAVATDASSERGPATRGASTKNSAPARTSATTTSTQPQSKPVPLLSAEEATKTFNLPPGFRAEVVAAEPLVQQPVAMEFDPDGRLWVVEMRGYMPDVTGKGEDEPNGRITILEDTDGDGAMDKRTIFLDQLVLPRSIGLVNGGALIGVPPRLLFARDTDGDDRADEITTLFEDYGAKGNPEHQPNGPLYGIDNWIYNSNYERRLRRIDGKWVSSPIPTLGQWGLSQDNAGQLFHNTNSDHLRGSLIPPHYATRNPKWEPASANARLVDDQDCWPAHATALNRGYREGFLRDGRLAEFTGACGPVIYRGELFPPAFHGNAFVCEPTANLIRRTVFEAKPDGSLVGRNAYDEQEFIASTYERFRPVNLYNGPDGALYIVDMHHGLIQHKQFLTDYAKKLYLDRNLDEFLLTGRIYRIVPEDSNPVARPRLTNATTAQLVQQLSHPDGWWRDTAQRLLVERRDDAAAAPLRKMATGHASPLARLHALWTLEGLSQLDAATTTAALNDQDPKVRAAAIRASEGRLAAPKQSSSSPLLAKVLETADDQSIDVRVQLVLSVAPLDVPEADEAIERILRDGGASYVLRDSAISGMRGREIDFLRRIMNDPAWAAHSPGRHDVITDFSRAIIRGADRSRVAALLDLLAAQSAEQQWRQLAILEAFPEPERSARRRRSNPQQIALDGPPVALVKLSTSGSDAVRTRLEKVEAMFTWPGKPAAEPPPKVAPLTPEQQARFERGKIQYTAVCGQCHKPDGMGQVGLAPPLVNSEYVLGPESRLARIVLQGLRGPVEVQGKTFNLDMPGLSALDDEQIAAVLTYIRREWGHAADPVDPKAVEDVRGATSGRREAWSAKELEIFR